MNDGFGHLPVFAFGIGTKGTFKGRDIIFEKKIMNGYRLEYLPHPDAASIPTMLVGKRPDIEFVGTKFHPHEELTHALLSGDLVIAESSYSFIDDTQRFRPDIVAELDPRRMNRTVIRYASVLARREMRSEFGRDWGLDKFISEHQDDFLSRIKKFQQELSAQVDAVAKRRHPFRAEIEITEPVTARTSREWEEKLRDFGFGAIVDRLNCSGNRSQRFHPEVAKIIDEEIDEHLKEEKIIGTHVDKAIRRRVKALAAIWPAELARREAEGELIPDHVRKLPQAPSYHAVLNAISSIGSLRRLAGEKGIDWLLRNRISKGMGIEVTRAGQIVVCDEYESDLFTLVSHMQIVDWIGYAELQRLGIVPGLNPVRCTLSIMMDVYTECILGLKISLRPSKELAKATLMMAMTDKTKLSLASGCMSSWNHMLRPEIVLTDGGNAYISFLLEKCCCWSGIDKQTAPAGLANLRATMERLFRTVHTGLLARFGGRTFKDVVERGEYDSAGNAVLSLDDFVRVLTLWVVDCYHNSSHAGLGDNITPNDVWYHEMTKGQGVRPVPSLTHMARVFGTTVMRIPQDTGIQVARLHYDSPAFVRWRGAKGRKRPLRVCWWEERLDQICVEVEPDVWMDLEVMDPEAKGLCIDEWLMVWQRREIDRVAGKEAAFEHGLAEIEKTREYAIQMRGKMHRDPLTPEGLNKLEEKMVRFTQFPSRRITSEQVHGVTGVPVLGDAQAPETLPPLSTGLISPPARHREPDPVKKKSVQGRNKGGQSWETGEME